MAIYSFALNTVARADGGSAVHTAAYLRREARTDERTGIEVDYSRSAYEVLAVGVVGPVDWQAAERAERAARRGGGAPPSSWLCPASCRCPNSLVWWTATAAGCARNTA